MLTCHDDQAELRITNEGKEVRIYFISIAKGNRLLELKRVSRLLGMGESLIMEFDFHRGYKLSILMDKGVIPDLECGEAHSSQP